LLPSGFVTETFDCVIVTPLTWTVTARPALPSNRTVAFWPGVASGSVTAAPPIDVVAARSGGTS
jgi:hypothetical protein